MSDEDGLAASLEILIIYVLPRIVVVGIMSSTVDTAVVAVFVPRMND